ncbi:MAG: hypothetical protein KDK27_16580 [Leptospiraceae bacterium]|nr:hypothetical protein [Leptospiraceae bacterium]
MLGLGLALLLSCAEYNAQESYLALLLLGNTGGGDGTTSSTPWATSQYTYRRRITFGTAHSLLRAGYTATISLDTRTAATNVALASGNDVRIFWQPTVGSAVELDRIGTTWNNSATSIDFRLQSDITANLNAAGDGEYYVYYGNASAGTPSTNEMNVYYFADFFNRADSSSIGNGWTEWTDAGDADIISGKLRLDDNGDTDPPQVGISQTFALGAIPDDFRLEWEWTIDATNAESIWANYVLVGTNGTMVNSSRSTGVGAGVYSCESLGCSGSNGISNNMANMIENNITGTNTFRIDVDVSAFTYNYTRGGTVANNLAFVNNQTVLDEIRIATDNNNFSSAQAHQFDNLKLTLTVADSPEMSTGSEETIF